MSRNQTQGILRLLALLYILTNVIGLAQSVVNYLSGKFLYEGPEWIIGGEGKEFLYSALTSYGVSILGGGIILIYSAELASLVVRAYRQPDSKEGELHA